MARLCGALRPDVGDTARIAAFPRINATLPRSVDWRSKLLEVRDQGATDECVAYSCCAMKECQDLPGVYLSTKYIYNQRKNQNSGGMYLWNAMEILMHGTPAEWKYSAWVGRKSAEDQTQVEQSAAQHRIKAYANVTSLVLLKSALATSGPCIASFPVYNYDKFWHPSQPGMRDLGGHCITIVGYNDVEGVLIIRNSWGKTWGEGGYGKMAYADYHPWEAYSTIDEDGIANPEPKAPGLEDVELSRGVVAEAVQKGCCRLM